MKIETKKLKKYTTVYNQIIEMIQNGQLPSSGRLPSELDLAESLNVSRTTLRQALLLLKEDGFITMKKGSGNFIKKSEIGPSSGLEKLGHPIYKFCTETINFSEIQYTIEPPSAHFLSLDSGTNNLVLSVDRQYFSKDEFIGKAFSIIPIKLVEHYDLNIKDEGEIQEFVDKMIFKIAYSSSMEIKMVRSNKVIKMLSGKSENKEYVLFSEILRNEGGKMLMYNKYHIPAENVVITTRNYNNFQ